MDMIESVVVMTLEAHQIGVTATTALCEFAVGVGAQHCVHCSCLGLRSVMCHTDLMSGQCAPQACSQDVTQIGPPYPPSQNRHGSCSLCDLTTTTPQNRLTDLDSEPISMQAMNVMWLQTCTMRAAQEVNGADVYGKSDMHLVRHKQP